MHVSSDIAIGCAYFHSICTGSAFGSTQMTWTHDINMQGALFAHELAHNLGAGHSAVPSILGPSNDNSTFDQASTNEIQNTIAKNCYEMSH